MSAAMMNAATTMARCWLLERQDGVAHGFTDHDGDIGFDGVTFRADAGLSAHAIDQTTGLAVDNSEALGVLSDAGVSDADVDAGRLDGASVRAWLVNWADPSDRHLLFRGQIGEIRRSGGAFRAELRGVSEALNVPRGRVYQPSCDAVLGDGRCGVNVSDPRYAVERIVSDSAAGGAFRIGGLAAFDAGWFVRGRVTVLSGAASGQLRTVRSERRDADVAWIEPSEAFRPALLAGDRVRLEAGCDRQAETCRGKFGNFLNFQGFPDLPGEDWLMAYPKADGTNDGGSLRR